MSFRHASTHPLISLIREQDSNFFKIGIKIKASSSNAIKQGHFFITRFNDCFNKNQRSQIFLILMWSKHETHSESKGNFHLPKRPEDIGHRSDAINVKPHFHNSIKKGLESC